MSGKANGSGNGASQDFSGQEPQPDLPASTLDVQALDLGADVKAVGLELLETESREPVRGKEAAEFWAAAFPLLAADEPYVLDFFSHLDRVREFCKSRGIAFRENAARSLVIPHVSQEQLLQVCERFAGETFGLRAGKRTEEDDAELAAELSGHGLDGYQGAYGRYTFCAVCELDDGWVTLLSDSLWPSEVVRRLRKAAQEFKMHITRPQ